MPLVINNLRGGLTHKHTQRQLRLLLIEGAEPADLCHCSSTSYDKDLYLYGAILDALS